MPHLAASLRVRLGEGLGILLRVERADEVWIRGVAVRHLEAVGGMLYFDFAGTVNELLVVPTHGADLLQRNVGNRARMAGRKSLVLR